MQRRKFDGSLSGKIRMRIPAGIHQGPPDPAGVSPTRTHNAALMELHEYPRPDNDTGIGVHWAAGYATAVGIAKIRETWLPRLKALGVKWVKIYNHDGAMDFAELLLSEGIMPVVRIYQPTPNPTRLGVKELVHVESLIRAGVRYFEFNHEPDRDENWRSGRVPADGLELVTETTIANLELILEKGGMPSIPAVSNGSRWDLTGRIVNAGRRDLFDGPVWQAVHNYAGNRPLDFPYDIGNQEGAAYTARFFRTVAEEEWGESAWRGRSLAEVNRLRMSRSNPGATLADDHACWLAYEYFDELNRRHLGRSIPILSTEGGYLTGEDTDARYPATTLDLHMAQTLEACRIMMGSSTRFQPAPDYYFCTAFWLLANAQLGSAGNWWESYAWYSDRRPGGALPVVYALQAEPKMVRRWRSAGRVGAAASLHGLVLHGEDGQSVVLAQDGRELQRTKLDKHRRYRFGDLPPGRYTVRVEGVPSMHTVELTPAQNSAVVNFDLSEDQGGTGNSVITGSVAGGAGAIVLLVRADDGEEWVTLAQDDGSFRFVDLPAGRYTARVHPAGAHSAELLLDGANELSIALRQPGWGYVVRTVRPRGSEPANAIHCRVSGHNGVPVQVMNATWESAVALTGSAPDVGPNACRFAPLEKGSYLVVARDLPVGEEETAIIEARVRVDQKQIPLVDFVFHAEEEAAPPSRSRITGHVVGGFAGGAEVLIVLLDEAGGKRTATVDDDGKFVFSDLPPGLYTVLIEGADGEADVREADIALDGSNAVHVDLVLPQSALRVGSETGGSILAGFVPDGAGRSVRLIDTVGNRFTRTVDEAGNFRFEHLPAGAYALEVEGGYALEPIRLDGVRAKEALFSPLQPAWEADISHAGSMPGYSAVRVEVENLTNHPVSLWQAEGDELVERTGRDPDLGATVAEFKPLEPGRYMVRPHDVETVATVDLTGLESLWITFRRQDKPVSPHLLRDLPEPLAPGERAGNGHYLFIGRNPGAHQDIEALLHFVAETAPVVGRSVEDARGAARITLLGDVDDDVCTRLAAHGARVSRFGEERNAV